MAKSDNSGFQNAKLLANCKRDKTQTERKLIRLLQAAHAGERAAAFAYRGHTRILKDKEEIALIRQIEAEEWHHRAEIFRILTELNAKPAPFREFMMFSIGTIISFGCFFCRRYWATFFAGKLEESNVKEYAEARKYAEILGFEDYAKCFAEMERNEFRHEKILRNMIARHWLLPASAFVFRWGKDEKFSIEG